MTVTHHPWTEFGAKQFPEGENEGLMNFGAHFLKMATRQDHDLPGMGLQPRRHGRQRLLWEGEAFARKVMCILASKRSVKLKKYKSYR